MKQIFTLLTVFLTFFTIQTHAQAGGNIDNIVTALKKGDANELTRYVNDNVDITLPSKTDTYSKAQAQMIIKDFFSNNEVTGFELNHKGDSPGGTYCMGTLQTKNGNFRAQVFMKVKNGANYVKEIRFQTIE